MSTATRSRRAPGANLLADARTADRGEDSIAGARRTLAQFEDAAEAFERSGSYEDAVATAQLAATMASLRHPGVHVSLRLESLLARVGAATLRPIGPRGAGTGRVLHYASETYSVGGHTRVIWRWIERDRSHTPVLVLGAQRSGPVPPGLVSAVEAAGGRALTLDPQAGWIARAQALRELAADADTIVIHAHPMDPLPALAFADAEDRPPVVVFNHADHVFWLGASIADVVQNIRPLGQEIAAARGIAAERRVLTASPVSGTDGNGAPQPGHRADVGFPADAVVLFSAGSADKYRGTAGLTLLDLVEPVLRSSPHVRLVVAGAVADRMWTAAIARHRGQIAVLGPVPALGPFFAAADIYLESQPFGGPGTSSEAAMHGLPVLTHAATEQEAAFFCTDPRYGATLAVGAREYRSRLTELIADPLLRERAGKQARETIVAADGSWEDSVREVYRRAAALGPASVAALAPETGEAPARDLLVAQCLRNTHATASAPAISALAANLRFVAPSPALRALWDRLDGVVRAPERRFDRVVSVPGGESDALRAVIHEFRALQALSVSDRFVIGLHPHYADAAIEVLQAALGNATITIDVVVDERAHELVAPGALEVVLPGAASSGRAPVHVCSAPRAGKQRRRARR